MRHFRKITHKNLGELLIERQVINQDQMNQAIDYQNKHGCLLGEAFVALKFATEADIAQALTCQYGFPYLPLSSYEIDPEVINSVPERLCHQYCVIPIDKIGKSLTVAMANPLNVQALDDIELLTSCTVQPFVSTSAEIKHAIEKYYKSSK